MEISDRLALEFNTILLSHVLTLLLLVSFSGYIFFRGKKSSLLNSYLMVVGIIALWMVAKIFKTLSPTIELRWFLIIIQYLAIDSLGVCLLIFTYIYRKDRLPSFKLLLLWSILPTIAFFVLLTNPIHMTFYSYFDIYRDRFGISFYITQSVQYFYLLTGIILLSKGFTKQPGFRGKRTLGILFSIFVLIPLLTNVYYVLFKMDLLPWIFTFPVFDFTPITASISLMLFIIPTLSSRIFDISPISLSRLYDIVPQGLIFADKKHRLHGANQAFFSMFNLKEIPSTMKQLTKLEIFNVENKKMLRELFENSVMQEAEILLSDSRHIKIQKHIRKKGYLLCLSDITKISHNHILLIGQNEELENINNRLTEMADTTKALAVSRTKSQMAHNVHDILGHSLTVVIGNAELAARDDELQALNRINQIEELLTESLNDLKNALNGKIMKWGETTLINALEYLKNENIIVDIQIQGDSYELSGAQTEAIYRLCQEAVTNSIKHGKAKSIYIIVRFQQHQVEIFAVDNGIGCENIQKNYGILGIETRFNALSGRVEFASDGETGFTIHAIIPKPIHD